MDEIAMMKRRTLANGVRVEMLASIERLDDIHQTTEHGQIYRPLRFSIMGEVAPKGVRFGTNASAYGQVQDHLPASWVERRLWDEWHLNDMSAACAHMSGLPADTSYDVRRGYQCEDGTDYVYGTAWLVKPLTTDAAREILTTFDPATARQVTIIGRDGVAVEIVKNGDVLATMQRLQGQSVDWAITHEGWSLTTPVIDVVTGVFA